MSKNNAGKIIFTLRTSMFRALAGFTAALGVMAAAPAHAGSIESPSVAVTQITKVAQGAKDGDTEFSRLVTRWKDMDQPGMVNAAASLFIPTGRPVDDLDLSSNFGTRSDPFNGHLRRHDGVDIPGPVGTPIYATADGIVSRARWVNGYGRFIELNHGNDLSTRYGHMSKLLVGENERVRRGQLIGLMGSTGRSTGSHLHYEVRIAGTPVNPLPYITGSERALALNTTPPVAMGGPENAK